VSLSWLLVSVFGALPFVFSGSIPSFVNAFFESASGFSTTGASILTDIEILPKGILFWRSFTHWIGGMGILVVAVAVLPLLGAGAFQVFKAETPGPITEKLMPRMKDTASILYISYITLTLIEIILLMFGGMDLFDATVHTFGTLGTGGFSTKNTSIAAYGSNYIFIVISIFMILSGINFSLYYDLISGKWREVLKNAELRLYLGIILVAVIAIAINTNFTVYHDWTQAFIHSLFQTSSIITTTGYSTYDFDTWSGFAKGILFVLMFVGGCAGSTGGSIKVVRIFVLFRLIQREFMKILHPKSVIAIKMNQQAIPGETVTNIVAFFILYMFLFVFSSLLISLEGISWLSASSSVASTLGNIGPGFEFVGPTRNFSEFSDPSKILFSFLMITGRLELFTVMVLFSPKFWRP
jgi:trk system potassium uptake protein TrkH